MDVDFSTKILFEHIKTQTESKHKLKKTIYDKLLYKIQQKIFKASSLETFSILYEIPKFIIGCPIYSLTDCSEYIVQNLETNGFKAKLFNKNELKLLGIKKPNSAIIYISWEHLNENNKTSSMNLSTNNIDNENKYIHINNKKFK